NRLHPGRDDKPKSNADSYRPSTRDARPLPVALHEPNPNNRQRELNRLSDHVGALLKRPIGTIEQDEIDPGDGRRQDERDDDDGPISAIQRTAWGVHSRRLCFRITYVKCCAVAQPTYRTPP